MVFRSARGYSRIRSSCWPVLFGFGEFRTKAYDKTENRGVRLLVPLSGLRPYGYCERSEQQPRYAA